MKIGELDVSKIMLGSTEISSIYLGATQVYGGGGSNTHYFSGTATPNSSFNVSIFNGNTYESISFSSDASGNWEFTYSGNFEGMNGFAFNSDIRTVDLTYMNHNIIDNSLFQYCQNLSSVTIPNYVTEIGDNAFSNCNLQNVYIPDSVTNIGNQAFYSNSSLSDVHIGSGITELGIQAFYNNSIQRVEILATTPPTIDSSHLPFPTGIDIYVPCDSVVDYQSDSDWQNYNILCGSDLEPDPTPPIENPEDIE